MTHSSSPSRRRFLRGAGGAALALPMLESLAADAQEIEHPPMRMAFTGIFYGFIPEYFFPTETGSDYAMPRLLQPMERHRQDFSIFSGLDHNLGGGHDATKYFLTGIPVHHAKGYSEANISVDQKAASHVGSATRYPSLVLGCHSNSSNHISWTKNGAQVRPISEPEALYRALFQKTNSEQLSTRRRNLQERQSILDLVREQAQSIEGKVANADREKLDQYFTSVRELEQKIEQSNIWLDTPKPSTDYPEPKGTGGMTLVEKAPIYYDLMALALQTDSTRVITLSFHELGKDSGGIAGVNSGYHSLSHHGKVREAMDELALIEGFFVEQYARFIDKLKDIREPNGQSLLENTMAVLGSGMSNGNSHSNRDLPTLLAGGGFAHGEHHHFARSGRSSVPLCNLYVTMLQRFGMEIDAFNTSNGNLSELLG